MRLDDKWLVFILLCTAVVIVYEPTLSYPFVQDDWQILYNFQHNNWNEILSASNTFFRPVAVGYLFVMWKAFGTHVVYYRFAAMLLLATCSFLVYLIASKWLDRTKAFMSALLFVCSTLVLFDIMAWVAGAFDLLGMLFLFSASYLFLNGKKALAAIPLVLGIFSRCYISPSMFYSDPSATYHLGLGNFFRAISIYMIWIGDTILSGFYGVYLLFPMAIVFGKKLGVQLLIATMLCVFPFTLLRNHIFAYYLCYALLPLSILLVHIIRHRVMLMAFVVLAVICSIVDTRMIDTHLRYHRDIDGLGLINSIHTQEQLMEGVEFANDTEVVDFMRDYVVEQRKGYVK